MAPAATFCAFGYVISVQEYVPPTMAAARPVAGRAGDTATSEARRENWVDADSASASPACVPGLSSLRAATVCAFRLSRSLTSGG